MFPGIASSAVAMVTIAPELPGSSAAIAHLTSLGVRVSLGHTACDLVEARPPARAPALAPCLRRPTVQTAQAEAAYSAGATSLTHLFNAMTSFHHRDPGLVGLLKSPALRPEQPLFYGIIADGFHTHDAALQIAHASHPDGCILVTDAISSLGLPPGAHRFGSLDVHIDTESKTTVAGTDTLAGSSSSMDSSLRRLARLMGDIAAIEAASLHPAQMLGLKNKGRLDAGCDADIVMMDDSLNVIATFIAGDQVWAQ